ncbi:hypothetical protein AV530_018711 [Patagioenas fasciata monilis]|uniref:Uncharacterized protein n=1 Tax=Patagioenas fasciata monilis TaxID=372326 RepID=A0A1V4JJA9_PATFA|nr:hypothetical protein AV530_018711 [Patagioenas fasciata monilis]
MKTHILEYFGAKTLNVKPCLRGWTKRGPENYSENLEQNKEVTWDFSAPSSVQRRLPEDTTIAFDAMLTLPSKPRYPGFSCLKLAFLQYYKTNEQ